MAKLVIVPGIHATMLHVGPFVAALEQAGHKVRVDLSDAPRAKKDEIFVTHSGGLMLLPPGEQQQVFAIAPSYAPGRGFGWWLAKLLKNYRKSLTRYPFQDTIRLTIGYAGGVFYVARNMKLFSLRDRLPSGYKITYLLPALDELRIQSFAEDGINVGTEHDDVFVMPDEYVAQITQILQS